MRPEGLSAAALSLAAGALHDVFARLDREILDEDRHKPPGEFDGTTALLGLQVPRAARFTSLVFGSAAWGTRSSRAHAFHVASVPRPASPVRRQVGAHLLLANLGDSRAVLCRGGEALRLTTDHTPDLPDERKRIEACGGYVREVRRRRRQWVGGCQACGGGPSK